MKGPIELLLPVLIIEKRTILKRFVFMIKSAEAHLLHPPPFLHNKEEV